MQLQFSHIALLLFGSDVVVAAAIATTSFALQLLASCFFSASAVAQRFGHLSGEIYLNVVSKLQLVEAG